MLKIHTLALGSYQTNCYIVYNADSRECVLIDPGYEARTILDKLAELGLKPAAILLTHGHFDHVGAVEALVKATGCALWMHQGDYSQAKDPTNTFFYPLANTELTEVQFCEEAQCISIDALTFTVWETPGHTWGSVCYLCQDALFCGDTLFAGSCGRIDLPGGDRATMQTSLERFSREQADLRIFPGHGPSSTLAHEQQTNPYLGGGLWI